MARVKGWFRSGTAAEPRPNDIVTTSQSWDPKSSFTGKQLEYRIGSSSLTKFVGNFDGSYGVGTYYSKGIVFIDEVHQKGIIPANSRFDIDIYAKTTISTVGNFQLVFAGIFIWEGATDTLKHQIVTPAWGMTNSWANYNTYAVSDTVMSSQTDIVLNAGDRICVEFYGYWRVFFGTVVVRKTGQAIRYGGTGGYESFLAYPQIQEIQYYNKGNKKVGLI